MNQVSKKYNFISFTQIIYRRPTKTNVATNNENISQTSTPEPELLSPTQGSSENSVWDTMSELVSERIASPTVLPGPSTSTSSEVTSRTVSPMTPMTNINKKK